MPACNAMLCVGKPLYGSTVCEGACTQAAPLLQAGAPLDLHPTLPCKGPKRSQPAAEAAQASSPLRSRPPKPGLCRCSYCRDNPDVQLKFMYSEVGLNRRRSCSVEEACVPGPPARPLPLRVAMGPSRLDLERGAVFGGQILHILGKSVLSESLENRRLVRPPQALAHI